MSEIYFAPHGPNARFSRFRTAGSPAALRAADGLGRRAPDAVFVPLKIMQYGYLPGDDALRAAGKAVSGKTWQDVLVLDNVYQIDHEYGWSRLLCQDSHAPSTRTRKGSCFFRSYRCLCWPGWR